MVEGFLFGDLKMNDVVYDAEVKLDFHLKFEEVEMSNELCERLEFWKDHLEWTVQSFEEAIKEAMIVAEENRTINSIIKLCLTGE